MSENELYCRLETAELKIFAYGGETIQEFMNNLWDIHHAYKIKKVVGIHNNIRITVEREPIHE